MYHSHSIITSSIIHPPQRVPMLCHHHTCTRHTRHTISLFLSFFVCVIFPVKTNGKTKRFYREVDVVQMNNGMWCPLLGGRAIQTRVGKLMMVPTQSLALAIAFEWDSQLEFIKPSSMPIMTLATTSMDQMVAVRPKIMHEIEGWIEADSTFNMMEGANSADGMSKLKRKYYRPLLEWMKKEYGIEINYSYSIRAAKQSEETKATIKNLYKDCVSAGEGVYTRNVSRECDNSK